MRGRKGLLLESPPPPPPPPSPEEEFRGLPVVEGGGRGCWFPCVSGMIGPSEIDAAAVAVMNGDEGAVAKTESKDPCDCKDPITYGGIGAGRSGCGGIPPDCLMEFTLPCRNSK